MTREQFLLLKLAEEAQEVAKRAIKQIQFGANQTQSKDGLNPNDGKIASYDKPEAQQTNKERLSSELIDMTIIVELLQEADQITSAPSSPDYENLKEKKIERLNKYLALSRAEAQVNGDWTI